MMKRTFDFVSALMGLLLLSPFLLVIALLIWLNDFQSPLFRQVRVGKDGQLFSMLKFRSMVNKAEQMGPAITVGEDPRITRIGRVLRKTKLDELPQLWNVLVGEMSLVGPRPEVPKYVELYSAEQRQVLRCRPGITDPASFKYFNEQELLASAGNPEVYYREVVMPDKIRINLEYQKSAGIISDFQLIVQTVLRVFKK